MALTKRRDIDMTSGSIFGQLLLFAMPLICSNILQTLYNAMDMMLVGLSPEPDAVGAIGTTGSFVSLIVNLFIGLSIGANVVVARHIGANERERAEAASHTAIVVSLIVGVLGGAIGVVIAEPVMRMLGNEGKLLELSVRYTRIYFAALPFHALSNYAIALYRAKGDAKTPLIVLSLSGILNVALNLFFVLVMQFSVEGVAIATGIAAAASALILCGGLMREKGPCHISVRRLRLDRREVKQILMIGIPSGVQSALFAISNMAIQSSITQVNNALCDPNAAYQPVVRGNSAVANLEGFVYTAINAVAHAAISFTGQNLGAGKFDRIKRMIKRACLLDFIIAVALSSVVVFLNAPLLALYGVDAHATDALGILAYESAMKRIYWTIAPYLLIVPMEIGSGVMRGLEKSLSSSIISLIGACLVRVVWVATVFRALGTLESIYVVYPITWVITGAILMISGYACIRKMKKEYA